ncbi:MAG: hypothetical protein HN566_05785, partial [Polaribacter sp.]|nr:hypothetical protein [Polaribacter sp.]
MEFLENYLNEDIIDNIFFKLSYKDKYSFLQLNRYTYSKYDDYIKYLVNDFLNTNYKYFKISFRKYKYSQEEIFDMGIIATRDATTVWGS